MEHGDVVDGGPYVRQIVDPSLVKPRFWVE